MVKKRKPEPKSILTWHPIWELRYSQLICAIAVIAFFLCMASQPLSTIIHIAVHALGAIVGKMIGVTVFILAFPYILPLLYPSFRTRRMLYASLSNLQHGIVILGILSYIPLVVAPNPNQVKDYDVLPGMRRWNGIPFHEFATTWWIALGVALGSIAQDGWTLLQTAQGVDLGAPNQGGNAQAQQQSANRNVRLFNCILNYINTTSSIYRYVVANFALDGRGLYQYLAVYGILNYSPEEVQQMEAEWEEANMSKVEIVYDVNAPFEWEEWVKNMQRKLGKTNAQARTKYLRGFPSSFNLVIVPEQMAPGNGNYVFPALFPGHHPQNGNADPQAGQPDLHAMALAFYPTWANMIKLGQIKAIPRGMAMARRADVNCEECSESDDEDSVASQVKRMTSQQLMRIVCLACGGIGHFARSGANKCLTLVNGVNVPKEDLQNIQYPNGLEFPQLGASSSSDRHSRPKNESASRSETGKFRQNSGSRNSGKPAPRRNQVRKPIGRAKITEVEEGSPGPSNVQDAAPTDGSSESDSSGDNHRVKWAVAYKNIVVS